MIIDEPEDDVVPDPLAGHFKDGPDQKTADKIDALRPEVARARGKIVIDDKRGILAYVDSEHLDLARAEGCLRSALANAIEAAAHPPYGTDWTTWLDEHIGELRDSVVPSLGEHECAPDSAHRMLDWIKNRGGIAVWRSVNLSNPGASWSTPAQTDGVPTPRPTWQADSKPERLIIYPSDVVVVVRKEVKRFHVGVRVGGGGFKVTDGGTRRIRAAVAKAGPGASYEFDYATQEAVITVPHKTVPLVQWCEEHPSAREEARI